MKINRIQKIVLPSILLISLISPNTYGVNLFGGEDENIIYEVGVNVYVKLVEQDDSSNGLNDHPINLDKKSLVSSLSYLTMKDENVLGTNNVFTIQQVNILAENLLRALSKADQEQDVVFAVRKSKDRILGLKDNQYYDTGRVFFRKGKLNLIVGEYDKPKLEGLEQAYDPTRMGITRYNFQHGSRTRESKKFKFNINDEAGISNSTSGSGNRLDWVEIDLDVASVAYENRIKDAKQTELDRRREELRELFGDEINQGMTAEDRVRMQKESQERRKLREEMARMRQEMSQTGSSSSTSPEQRLKKLKRLKDQELITHEEYVQKRKEILEAL